MDPVTPPATLPGKTLAETCIIAERLHTTAGYSTMNHCWQKCITHFGEDALPYHTGEKSCFDRCISKMRYGFSMAKVLKKEFNEGMKNETIELDWMRRLRNGE